MILLCIYELSYTHLTFSFNNERIDNHSSLRNYTTLTHKIKARRSHPKIHRQTNPQSDSFFHHGHHGNALGLLRLSLRESSSLRSSVNLTPSAQANLRDTEMGTKVRFALYDHRLSTIFLYLLSLGLDPKPHTQVPKASKK